MLIAPENFVSMPWKNGLGQTLELQKELLPDSDYFAWRISIAAVTEDGPFSCFAGFDRTLLLLEGNGITLTVSGGDQHVLDHPLQAARFRGDDNTMASLHHGPISDFNVMVSRAHCLGEVTSHAGTTEVRLDVRADVLLIYSVKGHLSVDSTSSAIKSAALTVPEHHLLRLDSPSEKQLRLSGAPFIAVQISYNQ